MKYSLAELREQSARSRRRRPVLTQSELEEREKHADEGQFADRRAIKKATRLVLEGVDLKFFFFFFFFERSDIRAMKKAIRLFFFFFCLQKKKQRSSCHLKSGKSSGSGHGNQQII